MSDADALAIAMGVVFIVGFTPLWPVLVVLLLLLLAAMITVVSCVLFGNDLWDWRDRLFGSSASRMPEHERLSRIEAIRSRQQERQQG